MSGSKPKMGGDVKSIVTEKQLISPHSITAKYQSISSKNDEIKAKVKLFENLFPS